MIPFVPVTVSRMIAATVWAPSYCEDLLEVRRAGADRARIGMAGGAAVGVRVERAHDAGHAGLDGPAARVAGERDGAVRGTVVGAVARDDLVAAGDHAGELDRVLVRLGAAVREERDREIAGRHLGQHPAELRARLVRHRRPDRAELVGLILDRLDDLRVLVPDVDVDELRREVEVALAVVVPEVTALGAGDRDRVDRALHRPRVEDVLLRVGDDLRAEIRVDASRVEAARVGLCCGHSASSLVARPPIVARPTGTSGADQERYTSCSPNFARSTNWPNPGSTFSSPSSTTTVPRISVTSTSPVTSVPS